MDSGFDYIIDKGIANDQDYPYTARNQICKTSISRALKTITDYVDVKGCDNVLNSLNGRPISVAVDASNWSAYRAGVFSNCNTNVNHGVLLVAASGNSWKIKNSWGASWGESGYMRLGLGNTCAICDYASYPVI
jgi:C1A family cysteine protease